MTGTAASAAASTRGPTASAAPRARRQTFFRDEEHPEPHAARRKAILTKYPEITKLMGPEPRTKWIVLATVVVEIALAFYANTLSWPAFLLLSYCVGAVLTQSLFLAIHELSHRLGSRSATRNRLYTLLANLPIAIPFGITFAPYHLEHHRYQGVDAVDTDLPTHLEGLIVSNPRLGRVLHCVCKALFLCFQLTFYAVRPLVVRPETYVQTMSDPWLAANTIGQALFNAAIATYGGSGALGFLFLSTFFAGSIHPIAAHFIAEHYVFDDPAHETYSYYGPLNAITYNVGYHNEHHDFPNVAWSKLPEVRRIASEFYDPLPRVESWWGVLIRFIFDDAVTPFNRLRRPRSTMLSALALAVPDKVASSATATAATEDAADVSAADLSLVKPATPVHAADKTPKSLSALTQRSVADKQIVKSRKAA